jgi:hypothetical protein
MGEQSNPKERIVPLPPGSTAIRSLEDFDVYYRTRLPLIRERVTELRASRRRSLEILFEALRRQRPFL